MIQVSKHFGHVVLQPTTLCNLDCRYCYLPLRKVNRKMSVEVAEAVSREIEKQNLSYPVRVLWHGGEPLACGIDHFRKLLEPFEALERSGKIRHNVQTNATLINPSWCQFFLDHKFEVGVSLDGPEWMPQQRVNMRGVAVFPYILRGINYLRNAEVSFSVIAVVNNSNIDRPKELYQFFCDIECRSVGFNIEEMEGVNKNPDLLEGDRVTKFWKGMLEAWKSNPKIRVREVNKALSFIRSVLDGQAGSWHSNIVPAFPTVMWNGDVVFLSPELAGAQSERYGNFVAGNVLETDLRQIVEYNTNQSYVRDFVNGISRCQSSCSYFNFCKGGQASNKYQERGTTDATETEFCKNSKQRLIDAVIK